MINPLTGKDEPVRAVLRSMAGQEGHDGEPYDQMQEAADYIEKLESALNNIHDLTLAARGKDTTIWAIHTLCDINLGHTI